MRPCLFAAFLLSLAALAQPKPEFDVASVRMMPPGENYSNDSYMPTLDFPPGGNLRIANRRLDEIIMVAYDISAKQLVGPKWLTEPTTDPTLVTRYEVVAKVPEGSKKEQIQLMLQKLLEDRFKLQVHREKRQAQVFVLQEGKNGHKLNAAVPNADRPPGCARTIGGGTDGAVLAQCSNITTTQFALQLPTLSPAYFRDGPVVDRTGLTGTFDMRLEWMMQMQLDAGQSGPTLFEAVEKLGLKLEKQRDELEVMVVDRAEPTPTEN